MRAITKDIPAHNQVRFALRVPHVSCILASFLSHNRLKELYLKRSEINLEDLLCFNGYVVEQPTSKLSQFINLSKAFFFHSTSLMEAKNIYERYFRHYLLSEKVKTGL